MRYGLSKLAAACVLLGHSAVCWAATPTINDTPPRPTSAELLPAETFVYVAIDHVPELRAAIEASSMGQMAVDPLIAPVVEQAYQGLSEQFEPLAERLGLSLSELLDLPQGEVVFAVVPVEKGRQPQGLLALVDTGDRPWMVDTLLEKGSEELVKAGARRTTRSVGDVEISVFEMPGQGRDVSWFVRQNTLVVGTQLPAVEQVVHAWNNRPERTLADANAFASLMRHVGEDPQVRFFIDPVGLFRTLAQGNTSMQIAVALLPALGLDGLTGFGGGTTIGDGPFNDVTHLHLLLDRPRSGVLELLALQPGDVAPERWAPSDAASYTTINWNFEQTYRKLERLIDSFQGEGAFARQVNRRVGQQLNLDVTTELLPVLGNRVSFASILEQPITPTSRGIVVGIKLKDRDAFKPTYDRLADQYSDTLERRTFAGRQYLVVAPPQLRTPDQLPDQQPPRRPARPQPAFCLWDDYLLVADKPSVLEAALRAATSNGPGLADSLEFKLIASKAQRQAPDGQLGYLRFDRPDQAFRQVYEVVQSERAQQRMSQRGEQSPFFRRLTTALEETPLPPFELLVRYFAPSGAVWTDEESGLHYTIFTLRRGDD